MERRTVSGAVVITQLLTPMSNSDNQIFPVTTATFPNPSTIKPMVLVIDRGTADEEKVLVTTKSGVVFDVSQRGYDGTTAVAHLAGATVDHVLDATAVQDMNDTTYNTEIISWMGI